MYMAKKPQIWIDYFQFLTKAGHITKTRQLIDHALANLPITQHELLWEVVVLWAEKTPLAETGRQILARYLQLQPKFKDRYIQFLIDRNFTDEAITRLRAQNGPMRTDDLCKLISTSADPKHESLICDIAESTENKGTFYTYLAEYYVRGGKISRARSAFENGLLK